MKKQTIIGLGAIAIGIAAYAGIRKLMRSKFMIHRKCKMTVRKYARNFFETEDVTFTSKEDGGLAVVIKTSLSQKQIDQRTAPFVDTVCEVLDSTGVRLELFICGTK